MRKNKKKKTIFNRTLLSMHLQYNFNIYCRRNSINCLIHIDIKLLVHFQRETSSRNFNARTNRGVETLTTARAMSD